MSNEWFISLDGDDIGRQLEKLIITNDHVALQEFSDEFELTIAHLRSEICQISGARLLLCGGDSVLVQVDEVLLPHSLAAISKVLNHSRFTFSGGYGRSMCSAYLSLKLAKARGKNQVIGPIDVDRVSV